MGRNGLILGTALELLDYRDDSPSEKVLRRVQIGAGVSNAIFYLASKIPSFVGIERGQCREQNFVFVFDVGKVRVERLYVSSPLAHSSQGLANVPSILVATSELFLVARAPLEYRINDSRFYIFISRHGSDQCGREVGAHDRILALIE